MVCGKYSEKIIPDGTSDSGESKFISALCSISPDEFVDFGSENFKTYGLLEDDAVNVYITFSSKDKICTTALKFGLGETKEFRWLRDNAHKFGFILRYPKDKIRITGINYEPWHYRYVGRYHATKMYELNLCLEEYIEYINQ